MQKEEEAGNSDDQLTLLCGLSYHLDGGAPDHSLMPKKKKAS